MIIYTRYKFNGEVLFSRFINFEEIMDRKYSCLGQMTRVTIKGGKTYEGFADEPYLSNKGKCLTNSKITNIKTTKHNCIFNK